MSVTATRGAESCVTLASSRKICPWCSWSPQFAAHRGQEGWQAEASRAPQVTAVALGDDGQGSRPRSGRGRGSWLSLRGGRPHAFEEVTDLLDLADGLGDQVFTPGPR